MNVLNDTQFYCPILSKCPACVFKSLQIFIFGCHALRVELPSTKVYHQMTLRNTKIFSFFPFELPLKIFKTRLLGRSFHILINRCLVTLANILIDTCSSLQSMWYLTIYPLSRPSILIDTCSSFQPMWDLTPSLFLSSIFWTLYWL